MPTEPSRAEPEAPRPRRGRAGTIAAIGLGLAGLALLGVVALGRLDRGPGPGLALPLLVLPHLGVVWGGVLFAVWCVLPDRRVFPAMGAVGLLAMAGIWGPSWVRTGDAGPGEPVTVVTWNLRRLWGGPEDGGDAFQCVLRTLKAADPDVLALMEVSRENLDLLEPALGMTCAHGTYLASGSSRKGGVAACGRGDWKLTSSDVVRFDDDEDWRYVVAELTGPRGVLNLLAVHLTPFHGSERSTRGQADQTAALLARVERFQDPTVLAGDFNSTRDFYLHGALRERLTDVWERAGVGAGATRWIDGWIPIRIDFVYTSAAFGVTEARVLGEGCSDHLPVVADLVLRDP